MKKRNKQITNLLKLGVFLFGFSLLLWNCQDETIEKQENNIATVGLEEALSLFKANGSAKLHTNTYFIAHLEKIHQEEIINSEERLTIIPVSTKDSGYYSRIVLLKVNGNIQSVIFSMYPSSTKKETKGFTGEIIITDLEGNFLKGYRANSGNLITKFTKKVLSVNKSSKGGVCPDHGDCTANSLCVYCTQELDEVVVSGNTSGGSAPVDYILDFSGTESGDGSSGDPNTSMGWDYGDGGGGGSSDNTNTTEEQIINKLTGKALCVYNKLQAMSTDFKNMIQKFDGEFPVSHLKYSVDNSLPNNVNAITDNSDEYIIEVKLNGNNLSDRTVLGLARTLIHETIHAEMYRKLRSVNYKVSINDFPGIYDYYRRHKNWQHQQMATHYVETIVDMLKKFDSSQNSDSLYNDLAWEGLQNTVAWNNLSNTERDRIKNNIKNYKDAGSKTCN